MKQLFFWGIFFLTKNSSEIIIFLVDIFFWTSYFLVKIFFKFHSKKQYLLAESARPLDSQRSLSDTSSWAGRAPAPARPRPRRRRRRAADWGGDCGAARTAPAPRSGTGAGRRWRRRRGGARARSGPSRTRQLLLLLLLRSMRWTHTQKTRGFHTNFVLVLEAVNYHTKNNKKIGQSAFHTDLVNWHTNK